MTASGICSVCPGGSHVTPRAPRDLHRRRFLSPCGGEGRASGHVTAVRPLSQSGAVLMMPYRRRRCRSHWGHRDPPGMPTWAPPTHVPRGPMERLQNRDCVSRHAPWSLRARQSRDCPQVPSQLLPKCLPEPAAGESLLWHLQLLLTWGAAQGGGTTAVKGTWDQRRHQQSKKHFPSCSSFSTHSTLSMELKTGDQERDFAPVAGSAAGHLSLSHLADVWNVVYELQSTIEFPSLQGFPQRPAVVSPLCPTLHPIPLSRCVWMGNHFGIVFKSCQLHSIQGAAAMIYSIISIWF
ncbi:uncharacterized protein LOC131590197 isoform X10 [Poecile atricapillus]|uniref:uncharacterized protein LOC131590197 isoform X10 n=1 Tax=Poecile atricapillus TaxID=48891 RepID=UPI0027386F41|nr:uncharacterized protein LOC131590197 isoform X10 [Poecile atricapillus]XP_058716112.1 uncharacterized protein LOC131590197 isoform X10 [Poecile atricapillus]XP_058716113.1 uncharacterized protein LOC131590197 isoform X10 [Poecile atricapillus]